MLWSIMNELTKIFVEQQSNLLLSDCTFDTELIEDDDEEDDE